MAIEAGDSRMIAKLFYLTTPAPNRYVVNFQLFGSDELLSIEISKAHLTNVIIDGASLALREVHHRVPKYQQPRQSMSEPSIGHNSEAETPAFAKDKLQSIVDRIERLDG